jgi:hypothetical protein
MILIKPRKQGNKKGGSTCSISSLYKLGSEDLNWLNRIS